MRLINANILSILGNYSPSKTGVASQIHGIVGELSFVWRREQFDTLLHAQIPGAQKANCDRFTAITMYFIAFLSRTAN